MEPNIAQHTNLLFQEFLLAYIFNLNFIIFINNK